MNVDPLASAKDSSRSSRAKEGKSLIKKTFGLAACGVMAALAAAGCSSGSSGSSATAGKGADPAASATAAASPKAMAPAWAKSLGSGVTVTGSSTAKAGDGSPAGVFLSLLKDVRAGNVSRMCAFYEPSIQSECKSQIGSMPAAELKSFMPTYKDLVPSYTAFDGDKALLGFTGTACSPGSTSSCTTNTNPAALFDSGKSFSTLWQAATADSNSNQSAYSLGPLIRVNGTWYFYTTSM